MSITKQAVAAINRLGHGTVDDVAVLVPGYTRAQLFRALKHAADSGQIDTSGWRAPNGPGGSPPATYCALKKTYARPAASVWHFAEQCRPL